jgi:hypothetical protein
MDIHVQNYKDFKPIYEGIINLYFMLSHPNVKGHNQNINNHPCWIFLNVVNNLLL